MCLFTLPSILHSDVQWLCESCLQVTLLICYYGNHPLSSIIHHLLVQSADGHGILTVTYRYMSKHEVCLN